MVFKIGQPISTQLSDAIKNNLTGIDYVEVGRETGFTVETARSLVFMRRPITEKNQVVVIACLKRALANAKILITQTKGEQKEISNRLKAIA